MKRLLASIIIFTFIPASVVNAAGSLNEALKKCSVLARDLQRLSCYDRLGKKVSAYPEEVLLTAPEKTPSTQQQIVKVTSSTKKELISTIDNTKPSPSVMSGFGSRNQDLDVEKLFSSIPGEFTGWKKGDKLTLANGQVWKIVGSKSNLFHKANNPQVTISRGMFNSYRINIKGVNKSARAIRIK